MKIKQCQQKDRFRDAFTMVDILVSMGVVGITTVSLYAGFSLGFTIMQGARENLRATQIIMEKFETIRLYNWEQINSNGFIPTNFASPYAFNDTNTSFNFEGQLTISDPSSGNSYDTDMKLITVRVNWKTGGFEDGISRTREMSTMVSRYGLQHYVY